MTTITFTKPIYFWRHPSIRPHGQSQRPGSEHIDGHLERLTLVFTKSGSAFSFLMEKIFKFFDLLRKLLQTFFRRLDLSSNKGSIDSLLHSKSIYWIFYNKQ